MVVSVGKVSSPVLMGRTGGTGESTAGAGGSANGGTKEELPLSKVSPELVRF
ncbi:hypothetical protein F2Q69_00005909 [Brassica cretica]|uniref:Uncharacterized protein n=1 Tax=Brassica cretica TaxID=69181 RepID=A0A8S9NUL1_BRACR|nr:hypothetical protein F2Q69_00005909 [Brassica cretica]